MSEIWRRLSSIYSCTFGFCRQFSHGVNVYCFPFWTDGRLCKSFLSPKSILFLPYLLLYLSLFDSVRVRLQHKGMDVFRFLVVSAQYKSIQSIYCSTESTCIYYRFPPEAYRCLLVFYCVFFRFELQSESSTCRICVIMSFLHYWCWCWITANL